MISKPQPDEYAPYAAAYIAKVPEGDIIEILEKLKDSSYKLFSGISEEQAAYAYAEGKWTLKEVLGHIIDTERFFSFRAFCFSRGEQSPLPGFEQTDYVENATFNTRTIQDLANEYKTVRESSLYVYRSLSDEQALRKGVASNYVFSVRGLVYLTAGHELYHLDLIKQLYLK
jgi:uncharacterized damage-inducible protein DinB